VQLDGTGTIRVHTTAALQAALTGTGTIRDGGAPTVTMRNTGTGVVVPEEQGPPANSDRESCERVSRVTRPGVEDVEPVGLEATNYC
jgi:hypothetical protein